MNISKKKISILAICLLIGFFAIKSFAKESNVEFYIMKKDTLKELLQIGTLKSLSTQDINLSKISLYHGVSSIPCVLVLKSSSQGFCINMSKKGKLLSYSFMKLLGSVKTKKEFEVSGSVILNKGTFNVKDKWENDEYVILVRQPNPPSLPPSINPSKH